MVADSFSRETWVFLCVGAVSGLFLLLSVVLLSSYSRARLSRAIAGRMGPRGRRSSEVMFGDTGRFCGALSALSCVACRRRAR